jgi:hypothetical protein
MKRIVLFSVEKSFEIPIESFAAGGLEAIQRPPLGFYSAARFVG